MEPLLASHCTSRSRAAGALTSPGALVALTLAAVALLPTPALAAATVGGSQAAPGSGGRIFRPATRDASPRVREFRVTPGRVTVGGVARWTIRFTGETGTVRTRVDVVTPSTGKVVARVALGRRAVGVRVTKAWRASPGRLPAGRYVARLHAVDAWGRVLRRATGAGAGSGRVTLRVVSPKPAATPIPTPTPGPAPIGTPAPPAPVPAPVVPGPATAPALVGRGRFPVQGVYSLGGAGARFGAGRTGHTHQGQDVVAAQGVPIVSPVAGVVHWRAYQAAGAGYYLVVRPDPGAAPGDLVFMHLREGSLTVVTGQRVAAGQKLGEVGNTGVSEGPHLHFELWPGGWWEKGGAPIDPLAQLQAWGRG